MLTLKPNAFFFDRKSVASKIDKAKRQQLSKAGAFVRRRARGSIKPAGRRAIRKKRLSGQPNPTHSRPGQPPRMHTKPPRNLRLILFGFEAATASVIVGPAAFQNQSGQRNVSSILEFGGRTKITDYPGGPKKLITVAPRPYMAPALAAEAPKFPDLFRNSVRP